MQMEFPHDYDLQASCPQTLAWLHEAVGGARDQVQVLRAYAKAVVTRRVDLQRYLETLGPGGTGKGTYSRLRTLATRLRGRNTDARGTPSHGMWLCRVWRLVDAHRLAEGVRVG